MEKMKLQALFITFTIILTSYACVCMADSHQVRHPYRLGGVRFSDVVKEAYLGARMGSYKPDLGELDDLIARMDMDAPGASTMYSVFARLKSSPQLSYLVEAGYWENNVFVEQMGTVDVGATFTQLSLSFLYYPELIQEYAPLYLGIGGGVANVKVTGSALALLSDVVKKRESTGISGNFIVGLEYMILERVMLSVQANRIFKSLTVDEEGEREFTFDGTVVSIGVSGRL